MIDRPGLQPERTALAWERTAIASMVAGVLLARYAATSNHLAFALAGILQVAASGSLLVWSSSRYFERTGPIESGAELVHPGATRIVGLATIAFSGLSLALALILVAT